MQLQKFQKDDTWLQQEPTTIDTHFTTKPHQIPHSNAPAIPKAKNCRFQPKILFRN